MKKTNIALSVALGLSLMGAASDQLAQAETGVDGLFAMNEVASPLLIAEGDEHSCGAKEGDDHKCGSGSCGSHDGEDGEGEGKDKGGESKCGEGACGG